MDWLKKYWWLILVVVFLLFLPLLINLCYLWESNSTALHAPSDWATFWATYLAAIASFAMVLITWWTLKESKKQNDKILMQNQQQLDELKRQWEESNRPWLVFTFACKEKWWTLKIENIGNTIARNVRISLSDKFVDKIGFPAVKTMLKRVNSPFPLEAHTSKYFLINPAYSNKEGYHTSESDSTSITHRDANKLLDELKNEKLIIKGDYDGYSVDVELELDFYMIAGARVGDELYNRIEEIESGLIVKNNEYMPIQKSLDIIAKSMDKKN